MSERFPADERVAFGRDLAGDPHRVLIDLVDLALASPTVASLSSLA